ncbi:MAG: pentapeptide repeat-containing protein [Pirellulales bacterium]
MRRLIRTLGGCLCWCACWWHLAGTGYGQIYRWNTGEVIPGTEDIVPEPGAVLDFLDLQYANLQRVDLKDATFELSDMIWADLRNTDLTNGYFSNALLGYVDFRGATLTDAIFTGAAIRGANLSGATALGFRKEQLYSTINYQNRATQAVNLSNNDLTNWDLRRQNLSSTNFAGSKMTGVNLSGAIIIESNLSDTTARGFTKDQLYLTSSYVTKLMLGVRLDENNLSGWDFSGQSLDNASFTSAALAGTSFANSSIVGVSFANTTSAGFTSSQLYSTTSFKFRTLTGIDLSRNDLTGWNFDNQNLTQANFSDAKLAGAGFAGANISRADFSNTTSQGFVAQQLYSTANYQSRNLRELRMLYNDVSGWNLANQNLEESSFYAATMVGTNLTGADLTGATLSSAHLQGATFAGAQIDQASLAFADLRGADLRRANLTGTTLEKAQFQGAQIAGATLDGATSAGLTRQQIYSTASYQLGTLHQIGWQNNDLSEWDLSDQQLTNGNFSGTQLNSTRLDRSDLRGAVSFSPGSALTDDAILPDGHINGLTLSAGQSLLVRDDDGVAAPDPTAPWLAARAPIPILVQSGMSLASDSSLVLKLDADPWDSRFSFSPGVSVQLGGILDLRFEDNVILAQQTGRTFNLFNWAGVQPQGQFDVQTEDGVIWDISQLYSGGTVKMIGLASDLDADHDVDSADLLSFLANWTGSDYPPADKTWQDGDSNADGDVDSDDLLSFLSQWTSSAAQLQAMRGELAAVVGQSRVTAVPEPGAAVLALFGLSLLRCRRAKKNSVPN